MPSLAPVPLLAFFTLFDIHAVYWSTIVCVFTYIVFSLPLACKFKLVAVPPRKCSYSQLCTRHQEAQQEISVGAEPAFPSVKSEKQDKIPPRSTRAARSTVQTTSRQAHRKAARVGVKEEPSCDREPIEEDVHMVGLLLICNLESVVS
jgi:hypothetical protein